VENRALLGFLPALAKRVLGADLKLPNVATWWCGQPAARDTAIAHLNSLAISPAFSPASSSYSRVRLGADLTAPERERLIAALHRRGMDFVAQEVVSLSTMPVWHEGRLSPRPFQIRVFAAATENGWVVMPGGFCRVSTAPDARAISMQLGGMSADLWVLGDAPVAPTSLLPSAGTMPVKRHVGALTARSADNLFWFGRYIERAEATIRLVRAGHVRASLRDKGERAATQTIISLLVEWGALTKDTTALSRRAALAALTDTRLVGSAAGAAQAARRAASAIRERISPDVISAVEELAEVLAFGRARSDPLERADRSLRLLAALAGFTQENMAQLTGWRFLEIGRRIERALNTADFVNELGLNPSSVASLEALLELGDSSITYAQRYFVAAAQRPILDLLLLDDSNPRSCAFQIKKLRELVAMMPGESVDDEPSHARRVAEKLSAEVVAADPGAVTADFIAHMKVGLMDLSDAISDRYLVNRDRLAFTFRVDE
jgi:uncharacterized alpha-E superfamily protein